MFAHTHVSLISKKRLTLEAGTREWAHVAACQGSFDPGMNFPSYNHPPLVLLLEDPDVLHRQNFRVCVNCHPLGGKPKTLALLVRTKSLRYLLPLRILAEARVHGALFLASQ